MCIRDSFNHEHAREIIREQKVQGLVYGEYAAAHRLVILEGCPAVLLGALHHSVEVELPDQLPVVLHHPPGIGTLQEEMPHITADPKFQLPGEGKGLLVAAFDVFHQELLPRSGLQKKLQALFGPGVELSLIHI